MWVCRLPGKTWNRRPSGSQRWLPPHRRHLGVLRASVQERELLQLGLSYLIIVILHTERQRVHPHTNKQQQSRFQLHWIQFPPLSPGLQPREYLINVHYRTAMTAVPEAAKHFRSPSDKSSGPHFAFIFSHSCFFVATSLKCIINMEISL